MGHSKPQLRVSITDAARLDIDDEGLAFLEPPSPSQKVMHVPPREYFNINADFYPQAHEIQKCEHRFYAVIVGFATDPTPQVYDGSDPSYEPIKDVQTGRKDRDKFEATSTAKASAKLTVKEQSKGKQIMTRSLVVSR